MPGPNVARGLRLQLLLMAVVAGLVVIIPPARHVLGHGLALLATGQLAEFQQYLHSLGAWAPAVSIALMVAQALVVPLPVVIIMVANGLVFGLWLGMFVSLAGGLLGAITAYGIGRQFGRALVERLLPAASLRETDRLMTKYGGWAVVLGRWIPGVPGDPVSYASGVTHMPPLRFVLLTTLGLVPANLVTAYLGVEAAGNVPLAYWLTGWLVAVALWFAWRWKQKRR